MSPNETRYPGTGEARTHSGERVCAFRLLGPRDPPVAPSNGAPSNGAPSNGLALRNGCA